MEPDSEQLISEIKQVMEQYRREVPSGRRAWPESIKSRVFELNKSGLSLFKIAREIDIPYMTLRSWEKKALPGKFRAVAVKKALPATTVKPKTVKCHKTVVSPTVEAQAVEGVITMIYPSGIRIEGLTFEQVVELMKRCAP